jgi:hypothetical protein
MAEHLKKAQIQIIDLIGESVEHAVARRQKALESEGFERDLSGDENQDYSQIKGGGFQSIPGGIQGIPKDKIPTVGLIYPSPERGGELQ